MNIIEYQRRTLDTAVYPGAGEHGFQEINYLVHGLTSEAGEVSGKLKKIIRGDVVPPEAFLAEIGDVLWYLARICDNVGVDLEQVAEYNYNKLQERAKQKVIRGSGDNNEDRIIKAD